MVDSLTSEFSAAMRAGNLDRAREILPELPLALPDRVLSSVAELNMQMERWEEAAGAFGRMKYRNADAEMKRKLCGNLAAMKVHRPGVYASLNQSPASDRFSVMASQSGHPTVAFRNDAGATISMSAGNDPLGSVKQAMGSIDAAWKTGKALGLVGIGDGYLLDHLAKNPPELILGREHAVCVFEPDAQLALTCLMIHDFTGADGPIEQKRFSWYVGTSWVEDFREEFFADLFKMYPMVSIRLGLKSQMIETEMAKFLKEVAELDGKFVAEINPYYDALSSENLAELMGENPPRKPRVLVITTRFSSVLQYSSRDTAEAFEKLGWDVHLLIEPSAAHGMNRIAMRQALAEFKPDVAFQIDHLRCEHNDLFPKNLPSVCWVQDHLPNLMNAAAGASITLRDFILTNSGHRYQKEYGYPSRQMLHMTKATKVPAMRATVERDKDIVFVSNAGRLPELLVEDALLRTPGEAEKLMLRAVAKKLIDIYARGGCVETMPDLEKLVCEVEREEKRIINFGDARKQLIGVLWHPLNDALYRQQSLTWVAEAVGKLGLNLELYGNHWEKHPRFSSYAKGYVQYGVELEELTRRSKISLHIAPFSWLHQRVMDGYVAGGFFLMRKHLSNFVPYQLNRAADRGESDANELQRLIGEYRRLNEISDPVEHVRGLAEAGALHELPRLGEISFSDASDCARVIERFIRQPELAEKIAGEQRQYVLDHFTYESQMKRIVGEMGELIRKEAA
ncbi:MAG TPA: glycosyltransferase [Tepidisphaeraceae bacterium]|jgi:hypothetical protein|nr:glycosyltransferase [Tepidisphaeraceae bacterium]